MIRSQHDVKVAGHETTEDRLPCEVIIPGATAAPIVVDVLDEPRPSRVWTDYSRAVDHGIELGTPRIGIRSGIGSHNSRPGRPKSSHQIVVAGVGPAFLHDLHDGQDVEVILDDLGDQRVVLR